jgi:hypothetical protein
MRENMANTLATHPTAGVPGLLLGLGTYTVLLRHLVVRL